ncbi:MAG: MFS transporter [Myxococcota bacterium]
MSLAVSSRPTAVRVDPPAPAPASAPVAAEAPVPGSSWVALAVLFVVYMLNYLDRTLIYILFGPIKKEMKFTDLELALLGTTSFVIFYTLLGIPFGRLADRVVRKRMIAVGLVIWSVFSGLTGWMDTFAGIFVCRVMVGVGEATLGPAALSLLSDLFPPRMRATIGAIYSAGIPMGAGVAMLLGGLIGDTYGWRWAFYLLGFPGIIMAVAVLMLREPARGVTERATTTDSSEQPDWRVLFRVKALWFHYAGYALLAVAGNSLSIWMPTYMHKAFGLELKTVGFYIGLCASVGGLLGAILGGYGADWFRARHKGGRMQFTAMGALVSAPLWMVMLFADSVTVFLMPMFVLMGVALMWLGPAAADIQDVVGPKLRGLGVGVYFFIVNIVGYGITPPIVGRINDVLGVAQDPTLVRYSLLICPVACVLSAVMLWRGSVLMRQRDAN